MKLVRFCLYLVPPDNYYFDWSSIEVVMEDGQ